MFAHIDIGTKTILKRLRSHPRADGKPVRGLTPGTAIVPVTKRPIPEHDSRTHQPTQVEAVTESEVVQDWKLLPLPSEKVIQHIKRTAAMLITNRLPEWKQRNLLASTLAAMAKGDKKTIARNELIWGWVQSVRDESDVKEKAVLSGKEINFDAWPEFPS